ncbi:MAG TPA: polysaccharide deacetylase family protein [Syntrophorhabdaceae bacterium]|nr:polysaccharide deacetylase family protein [Syntrophorhabdaceae bacterium]
MAVQKRIGVAVHVDTYEGMKKGVPRLLALFQRYGIRASFFVPMGKDHTGRTVKRVFTRRDFLKKTGTGRVWAEAVSKKTLMYGLLLPGPEVAKKNKELLKRILTEGHELGIHGHNHVYWHDHIKDLSQRRTEEEIEKPLNVYRELTGIKARSFAAPGWMVNPYALRCFQDRGLAYTSDTRKGTGPFYPEMEAQQFKCLQIPTTLPTLDEVIGTKGTDETELAEYYIGILTEGLNVLTVHAEIEGGRWIGFFEAFIVKTIEHGFTYVRLIDVADEYGQNPDIPIPVCGVEYGYVEGRAGQVCIQARGKR